MSVQAFAAQLAVERFDERIVCGLSRAGEVKDHTALVSPQIHVPLVLTGNNLSSFEKIKAMKASRVGEPHKLKRWILPDCRQFYTSARPGRSLGSKAHVPKQVAFRWAKSLTPYGNAIVSLLGTKPDGASEFKFYDNAQADGREWLESLFFYPVQVFSFPTADLMPVPNDVLHAASEKIAGLLEVGKRPIVIDSGGESRTGAVCRHMSAQLVAQL